VGDKRVEIGALNKREDVRQRVKFDHGYCPRGDCDVGRVGASNCANLSTSPARLGTIVSPRSRISAMSSGVGVIVPRLIQARSFETCSACGSIEIMMAAPLKAPSAASI